MSAKLTLVVNPGSASRKYALYSDGWQWANIAFEYVDGRVFGKIDHAGQQQSKTYNDGNLDNVANYILPLLYECRVISESDKISTIGIRVVAPSNRFTEDRLIDHETLAALKLIERTAPLHITTVLSEINHLKNAFTDVPIIAVSDSAFHITKYPWAWDYGIDTDLANRIELKRFGYHGISVSSVIRKLKENNQLPQKTIVCHLGSGSSVTAVVNGHSVDTTMGYSPLEGLMMASRSGTIDIAAAIAIKKELNLDDIGLEKYLNKQSGLLGVSGSSNDIRQLISYEENGDIKASLALRMFVYRIQQSIGQMAASMDGADCLVFTATVGERSKIIRKRILDNLSYLGFNCDAAQNDQVYEPDHIANIADQFSKPIYVISTEEVSEIARRAENISFKIS